MTERSTVATLHVDPNVDLSDVQQLIDRALQDVADDPPAYGVSNDQAIAIDMRARQGEGQFGAAETILVTVAGGFAQEVLKTLWTSVVWPALRARFGSSVEQKEN